MSAPTATLNSTPALPAPAPVVAARRAKARYYVLHTREFGSPLHEHVPAEPLAHLHEKSAWAHFAVLAWQFFLTGFSSYVLATQTNPWIWIPFVFVQGFTVFNYTVMLHEVVHSAV